MESHQPPPRRACEECKRKKTRCDMQRPFCGLCVRVGSRCTFSIRQKSAATNRRNSTAQKLSNGNKLDHLLQLLANKVELEGNGDAAVLSRAPSDEVEPPGMIATPATSCSNDVTLQTQSSMSAPPLNTGTITIEAESQIPHFGQRYIPAANDFARPSDDSPSYAVNVTPELAEELIALYFTKVQPWLPMLHQPRFYHQYMGGERPLQDLNLDEALLCHGMLALSARHSASDQLAEIPAVDRGVKFATEAARLYKLRMTEDPPTLLYLQGCILLGFYKYSMGPCPRGWLLTGVVIRIAYELDLNNIDEDGGVGLSVEEWVHREELRRAWWLVWELDTFGSSVSSKPFAITRREACVHLPVSDSNWFSETPVSSAPLLPDPISAWKSLQGCENQDERAWFLISNFIMSLAVDVPQSQGVKMNEKLEIETSISCFNLVLPQIFRLENFLFDPDNFAQSNWIISTLLMILQTRILCTEEDLKHRLFATELPRIVGRWTPEYIALSHPFIACQMCCRENWASINSQVILSREVGKLVLSQYATMWKLGSILLKLVEIIESKRCLSTQERDLARRFIHFMPSIKSRNRGEPQRQEQQNLSRDSIFATVSPQGFNSSIDQGSSFLDCLIPSTMPKVARNTSDDADFSAGTTTKSNTDLQLAAPELPTTGESSSLNVRESSLERVFGNFFDGCEQVNPFTEQEFPSYFL